MAAKSQIQRKERGVAPAQYMPAPSNTKPIGAIESLSYETQSLRALIQAISHSLETINKDLIELAERQDRTDKILITGNGDPPL